MNKSFTIREFCDAAEKNKYKNFNSEFIQYEVDDYGNYILDKKGNRKVTFACVIGEAFLNLGMVENGVDANDLSRVLANIFTDDGKPISIIGRSGWGDTFEYNYYSLSDYINSANSTSSIHSKKKIIRTVRERFAEQLDTVIAVNDDDEFEIQFNA